MSESIIPARFHAALAARGTNLLKVSRAIGMSYHHLYRVANALREPSDKMLGGLREVLGPKTWRYVVGKTNELMEGKAR